MKVNHGSIGGKVTAETWHRRLSIFIVEHCYLWLGIAISFSDVYNQHLQCDSCYIGKIHKKPHYSKKTNYSRPLQLVFADVWGPAPSISTEGYRYYLSFVDACTNYNWIYLLSEKSEVLDCFI